MIQGHTDPDGDDFQRHPIPECGTAEMEALGSDEAAESSKGSDVTIPEPLGTDSPAPECDTGTPYPTGNEEILPGPVESDSTTPQEAGGGWSTPQGTENDVLTPDTTGSDVPDPGMPGHVMVKWSSDSDSYFLRLALFPSHKDLNSSTVPNILESEESVFMVPGQFQINGFR